MSDQQRDFCTVTWAPACSGSLDVAGCLEAWQLHKASREDHRRWAIALAMAGIWPNLSCQAASLVVTQCKSWVRCQTYIQCHGAAAVGLLWVCGFQQTALAKHAGSW